MPLCGQQGHRSLWEWDVPTSPQYLDRGHYHESLFGESYQVKLSSFDDFIAFFHHNTYFTLTLTKKLQLLGEPSRGSVPGPRWGTSVLMLPAFLLCPPIIETDRHVWRLVTVLFLNTEKTIVARTRNHKIELLHGFGIGFVFVASKKD